ncbi:hypothetical protein MICAI_370003 [Microcystis sp. T1-4]|nr:hypothetical protein MICAI_370003 [Microcystis sp. T1-4]
MSIYIHKGYLMLQRDRECFQKVTNFLLSILQARHSHFSSP